MVCRIGPDLCNQNCSDDRSPAATAEIEDSIADHQHRTVPSEITIHLKPSGNGENSIAVRAAAEGNVSVDVVNCWGRRGTKIHR